MAIRRHSAASFSGKTDWIRSSVRRLWKPHAKARRAKPRANAQARP